MARPVAGYLAIALLSLMPLLASPSLAAEAPACQGALAAFGAPARLAPPCVSPTPAFG